MKNLGKVKFESFDSLIKMAMVEDAIYIDNGHRFAKDVKQYEYFLSNEAMGSDPKGLVSEFLKKREELKVAAPIGESMTYDFSGDFVDVGRFLSGEPECMVAFVQEQEVKYINVEISLGRAWNERDERVLDYYAKVLNIVDELESNNIRCKITASGDFIQAGRRRGSIKKTAGLELDVKGYSESVDYKSFALTFLDNDFFTKAVLPLSSQKGEGSIFGGELDTSECWTKDILLHATRSEIYAEQSEQSIRFPSLYFWGDDWRPTQKEIIEEIGIGFLFK